MIRIILLLLLPTVAFAQVDPRPGNTDYSAAFANQTDAPALPQTRLSVEVITRGLELPWGITPLGDGQLLVTERPGRMRFLNTDGSGGALVSGLPEVVSNVQGGLLDVAASPNFAQDRTIFWTYTKHHEGESTVTAAARGILSADGVLSDVEDIFVQDPPWEGGEHYGSRIIPMPDGTVWITTGDRGTSERSTRVQDLSTTHGKVIRLNADGSIPPDNPFVGRDGDDQVWSFGHRNMQGAAIGPGGLWTIEHGPKGGDELNHPEAGLNYGWPIVSYGVEYDDVPVGTGQSSAPGLEEPVYYWDPVIAPAGMMFYDGPYADWQGDLLIASLAGALVRLKLEDGRVVGEEWMLTDVGRIRDVEVLDDGAVLLLLDAGRVLRVVPR